MRGWIILGMTCWLSLAASASLEAGNITIVSGSMETSANNTVGVPPTPDIVTASNPLSTTVETNDGAATNSTTYNFNNSGFRISVDHARPATANSQVDSSWSGPIVFTLDQDEDYSISGTYGQSGLGRLIFYMELTDVTGVPVNVFRNQQRSITLDSNTFTLGELEGQESAGGNFLEGSLTGTLLAGRTYQLAYQFVLQRWAANSAASADGFFELQIGDAPVLGVPEPSTAMLALLGVFGVGLIRRRK